VIVIERRRRKEKEKDLRDAVEEAQVALRIVDHHLGCALVQPVVHLRETLSFRLKDLLGPVTRVTKKKKKLRETSIQGNIYFAEM